MGVRIQELPETTGIKKEDVLIVEDGQGTKKGTVQQLDETLGVSQLKEDLVNLENAVLEDNYIDYSSITEGYGLSMYGAVIENSELFVTDFIPINYNENKDYIATHKESGSNRVAFYDNQKNFLSYTTHKTFSITKNVCYIRYCGFLDEINKTIIRGMSAKDNVSRFSCDINKSILKNAEIEYKNGYRYITNVEEIDITNPIEAVGYKCALIPCKRGDKFVINGGGGASSLLWAFLNNNREKIITSTENEFAMNAIITAPDYASYLVINDSLNKQSYKCMNVDNKTPSKNIYIAPSNGTNHDKAIADIICDGINDEADINYAISLLPYGGDIILLDGEYHIDSLKNGFDNSYGIYVAYQGNARTICIKGCTENKSYLSNYGCVIRVTETAFNDLDDSKQYSVIGSSSALMEKGDFYAHVNNINIENMYIFIHNSQKKVIGINGSNFGSMYLRQIGVYTSTYFDDRFNHVKPSTPIEGSIGVLSVQGSNDEIARIGMDLVQVGGFHTGIYLKGVDHLIMQVCAACRCVYGYKFEELAKTLTMFNCADEGNTHLPRFIGNGHLTCIDLNIERFNFDFIPDDPSGDTEKYATEEIIGGFKGIISYTMQSTDMNKFWKDGHGTQFKTIDLNNPIW